jgi:simple sugar transport system permease protein/ribose transport system permease protein
MVPASDVLPGQDVGRRWPDALTLLLGVVFLALVPLAVTTDRFLSVANGRAIVASAAFVGITAIGATLVMITGSAVSLAASQTASVVAMLFLSTLGHGLPVAVVLSLLCGVAITAVQGLAVGYWEANPIVLTIAAGFAIGGIAVWRSGGTPVFAENDSYDVLNSTVLGLPVAAYVLVLVAVLAEWVLRRTTAGRQMYLVGENRAAARAAGIPVGRVVTLAWALFGLCIATTGVFLASFHTSATGSLGGALTLDAISAVLVGGTAIAGGRGSALRTLAGAVLISLIANLLLIRGYSTGVQILAQGLLVLVVVVLVHLRATRAVRGAR